ncbi:MAG: 6-phosphogluconolactonase [Bacteroidales bacterium]|jgi:glucosamine-6-phosphate deaminase|nr:6-phosphogluconolactonase [Bacteroidales bacterium]
MKIYVSNDANELGSEAAALISAKLNEIIAARGEARIVVSTGSSQFEMFRELVMHNINWQKVEVFHLDEYIGTPITHKASFRRYLSERFISLVPVKRFHSIDVEGNIDNLISELTSSIRNKPIDLGIIGIGVNGHIAFNDPPADFDNRDAYIRVKLNKECKLQQVSEGWFGSPEEVPDMAVSMSVWQIMQSRTIISVVPHQAKAEAVRLTFSESVNRKVPATILKQHPDWHLFLDRESAGGIIRF